jgi:hypothetical protein
MPLPPLLDERSNGIEFALVVLGPTLFGIVTGIALGTSKPLYLALSLIGILGGFVAGVEHDSALAGFYRGLLGGLQFGTWILITHAIADNAAKADLPSHPIYLVAITAGAGALLGTLGGRYRAKRLPAT